MPRSGLAGAQNGLEKRNPRGGCVRARALAASARAPITALFSRQSLRFFLPRCLSAYFGTELCQQKREKKTRTKEEHGFRVASEEIRAARGLEEGLRRHRLEQRGRGGGAGYLCLGRPRCRPVRRPPLSSRAALSSRASPRVPPLCAPPPPARASCSR